MFNVAVDSQPLDCERLEGLIRKLSKQPELLRKYAEVFEEQLKLDIIERVNVLETSNLLHYLPHHCVIREDKKSTKIRVVFDASSRSAGLPSLNECLHRGPNRLPSLSGTLIRHRLSPISVSSDLERAFLQILLAPDCLDTVRFLFLDDVSKPFAPENIAVFRYKRIIFGVISSPYILAECIQQHLKMEGTPLAAEIARSCYADNILTLARTPQEAIEKCEKARAIFAKASFNLREFVSNDPSVNRHFNSEDLPAVHKFLGQKWDVAKDKILMELPFSESDLTKPATKREVLSKIASFYDPNGLCSPLLIRAKFFFQGLFRLKFQWDEKLPQCLTEEWASIMRSWQHEKIAFPRLVLPCDPKEAKISLVAFSDASKIGLGVCVYLRVEAGNEVTSNLLFAKSRLTPLSQEISIPRLELTASVYGIRALEFVRQQIDLPVTASYLFTDNTSVITWVERQSEKLPVYVRNRLKEICAAKDCHIGFIKGTKNPADLCTRFNTFTNKETKECWMCGPSWLRKHLQNWPHPCTLIREKISIEQLAFAVHVTQPSVGEVYDVSRSSSFTKTQRVVAYVLRFIHNSGRKMGFSSPAMSLLRDIVQDTRMSGPLYVPELMAAENVLIAQEQVKHPPTERETSDYNLSLNKEGLLTVNDRLKHAGSRVPKHPIFLSRSSELFKQIILDIHYKSYHAGLQHTLAAYRERFWTPKGRSSAKVVLHRYCLYCKKMRAKSFKLPEMAPLPVERLEKLTPWKSVGLGYMGSFSIKLGTEGKKCWVLLICCFSSRAIHLEPCLDMSTQTFINAFRRFVARRQLPQLVYSDNASQLILASKVFNEVWDPKTLPSKILEFFTAHKISWKYIPVLSSWSGGMYERLVGITKRFFKAAVAKRVLNFDEMQTVLLECEQIINGRPLCFIYENPDAIIITPQKLINPLSRTSLPVLTDQAEQLDPTFEPHKRDAQANAVKLWKRSLVLLDRFWQGWQAEYLNSLRERPQRFVNQRRPSSVFPQAGEAVLLHEENMPRSFWRVGIIDSFRESNPKQLKVAKVRVGPQRFLWRPVSKLYPLELGNSEAEVTNEAEPRVQPEITEHTPTDLAEPVDTDGEGDRFSANDIPRTDQPAVDALPVSEARARPNKRYNLRANVPRPKRYAYGMTTFLCLLQIVFAYAQPRTFSHRPHPLYYPMVTFFNGTDMELVGESLIYDPYRSENNASDAVRRAKTDSRGQTIEESLWYLNSGGTDLVNVARWKIKFMPRRSQVFNPYSETCHTCRLKCLPGKVEVHFDSKIDAIEVCFWGDCKLRKIRSYENLEKAIFSHSDKINYTFLHEIHHFDFDDFVPNQDELHSPKVKVSFWKEGIMLDQISRSCPATNYCIHEPRMFSQSFVQNPHCHPIVSHAIGLTMWFAAWTVVTFVSALAYGFIRRFVRDRTAAQRVRQGLARLVRPVLTRITQLFTERFNINSPLRRPSRVKYSAHYESGPLVEYRRRSLRGRSQSLSALRSRVRTRQRVTLHRDICRSSTSLQPLQLASTLLIICVIVPLSETCAVSVVKHAEPFLDMQFHLNETELFMQLPTTGQPGCVLLTDPHMKPLGVVEVTVDRVWFKCVESVDCWTRDLIFKNIVINELGNVKCSVSDAVDYALRQFTNGCFLRIPADL